jgi:hypothetical protein
MTVKSRVAYQEAISELKNFKATVSGLSGQEFMIPATPCGRFDGPRSVAGLTRISSCRPSSFRRRRLISTSRFA